jgi:periplasmic divalent cation tolerance protein
VSCVAITTTVGSRDDARRLARALVERHLAACAQLEAIESVYAWQGNVEDEPEVRVVFKTTAARRAAAIAALAELHPYDVPEIHAEALADVHPPYAEWIAAWVDPTPAGEAAGKPAADA